MAYTGTNREETLINRLNITNLNLKDDSLPISFNVDLHDNLVSYIQSLVEKINELEQKITEVHPTVETGFIQVFAGNAIEEETATILPPP